MCEVRAIVGLMAPMATGAQLARALIDIAWKYNDAKSQIEAFGSEIGRFSRTLDQLDRMLTRDQHCIAINERTWIDDVMGACGDVFSQADEFKDYLYGIHGPTHNKKI